MLGPNSFALMKQQAQKIVMLTAYDYASGSAVANSNVDVILVGDSLGMVVLGYDSTLKVTMDDMVSHTAAVRRGAPGKFIIADLPYLAYHLSAEQTKTNAARLIVDGSANAVKLEGGSASRLEAIRQIVDIEIPVCAHLGLTPQSVMRFGGYKVQGKSEIAHEEIFLQASAIEEAGAFMLVLEGIPELLGKKISEALSIPTIGIGAGRYCDGQVLVYHDMLGYSSMLPKFVKKYAELNAAIPEAINNYCQEVRNGSFPRTEHVYFPIDK
ncbi:MAG: 3-methyl-2-oxobutanoate hydroxymethyltransferase [Candidatus Cloacimonetes bacterium]|nr:3-methyl-2-oxobutanoate hydroxymethyltransferase [Candidatus Cloacimonadota bacterium]MDD2683509.1 3-methyl-2-oxobutanoate hydroxymethyltransferase [Candidatus Cloacimonadota bacterium]MDY0337560.1 3-methyl-2-oxobutanoate hydroxymethyltransferase [Candidatus Cloacimonadaceae bacterium]